jgi:hypothetical protein
MNEWLGVHGIGKHVPAVSGGTILLGSFKGRRKQIRNICEKEEFMKKWEQRSKRRVWKFQGDLYRGNASICPESYRKDQVL